jgi:Zn-dependent protease with chaperone function
MPASNHATDDAPAPLRRAVTLDLLAALALIALTFLPLMLRRAGLALPGQPSLAAGLWGLAAAWGTLCCAVIRPRNPREVQLLEGYRFPATCVQSAWRIAAGVAIPACVLSTLPVDLGMTGRERLVTFLVAAGPFVVVSLLNIRPHFRKDCPTGEAIRDAHLRETAAAVAQQAGLKDVTLRPSPGLLGSCGALAEAGTHRSRPCVWIDTRELTSLPEAQQRLVIAHEIGHLARRLPLEDALEPAAVTVAAAVLGGAVVLSRSPGETLYTLLPRVILAVLAAEKLTIPVRNAVSRWIERRAWRFAFSAAGNREALVELAGSLAMGPHEDHPLMHWLLGTHPTFQELLEILTACRDENGSSGLGSSDRMDPGEPGTEERR